MRLVATFVALLVSVAACGEDHADSPDAASIDAPYGAGPGPCWLDIPHVPKGTAKLGTGWDRFQAMPDVVPIEWGAQDGYMMAAHVRMTGFDPGDPSDIFNPRNPRTRIRAYFEDDNIPAGAHPAALMSPALAPSAFCPFRTGYIDAGDGTYELANGVPIVFETCWRADNLIGRRIRIEVEIMDATGGYAKDVRVVTAAPPTGFYPDDRNSPGCRHRYELDGVIVDP